MRYILFIFLLSGCREWFGIGPGDGRETQCTTRCGLRLLKPTANVPGTYTCDQWQTMEDVTLIAYYDNVIDDPRVAVDACSSFPKVAVDLMPTGSWYMEHHVFEAGDIQVLGATHCLWNINVELGWQPLISNSSIMHELVHVAQRCQAIMPIDPPGTRDPDGREDPWIADSAHANWVRGGEYQAAYAASMKLYGMGL